MKRQLAQVRPAGITAVSLYEPPYSVPYTIDTLLVANVSGIAITVSLFHDRDGTTYDEDTALIWNTILGVGEFLSVETDISDYLYEGGLGCRCSIPDGATFTVYGEVADERL